ncbi:MAG: hypothetical protein ACXWC2_03930 [Ramlibacter sp.]
MAKATRKAVAQGASPVKAARPARPGARLAAKASARPAKADRKPAATASAPAVATSAVKPPKALKATKPAKAAKPPKADKPRKPKLVRDSFTIPKPEYAVLDTLKARALKTGKAVKKSELLRAGIKALAALPDLAFVAALDAVPTLKTGRPAKG